MSVYNRKEYMKEYHLKNCEKHLANMKEYREKNKEELKPAKRDWYDRNKDLAKSRAKKHYEENKPRHHLLGYKKRIENPERYRLYTKVVLANKRSKDKIGIEVVQAIYESNIKIYGTLSCYLCSNAITFGDDSLDHKMPISRGGLNVMDNLGIAHRKCNSIKGNKTFDEYIEYVNKIKAIMESQ